MHICLDSEQRHGLQVLLHDGVHHYLKHHLHVGGVRRRGEVMIDQLLGREVLGDEHGGDEASGGVHIVVGTWRDGKVYDREKRDYVPCPSVTVGGRFGSRTTVGVRT